MKKQKIYSFVLFPLIKGWKDTSDGFEIQVQRPDATHKFVAAKDVAENAFASPFCLSLVASLH